MRVSIQFLAVIQINKLIENKKLVIIAKCNLMYHRNNRGSCEEVHILMTTVEIILNTT